MNVLDLFSGAGGLSYGLARNNLEEFDVVGGIDIDEKAIKTFEQNHNRLLEQSKADHKVFGKAIDLTTYSPQNFQDEFGSDEIDLIVGGPPCKGFSSIRPFRSENKDDDRNNLYQVYLDYVEHFSPDYFVMENVVQMVKHDDGAVKDAFLETARENGYNVRWRVLHAASFGVPQHRPRVIFIGSKKKTEDELVFPEPTHYMDDDHYLKPKVDEEEILRPKEARRNGNELKREVTVKDAIGDLEGLSAGQSTDSYTNEPQTEYQQKMRDKTDDGHTLESHNATNHGEDMLDVLRHQPGHHKKDITDGFEPTSGYSSCYSRMWEDRPAGTLTSNFTTASAHRCVHPTDDRALTVREGARIQSFPDEFRFVGSKTEKTSQIGNAVPPRIGEAIANAILQMERE